MGELADAASPVASEATAKALEFPSFVALHAELAATDLGRDRLSGLQPLPSVEAVEERQRRVRDTRRLLEEGSLIAGLEEPLAPLLEELEGRDLAVTGAQLRQLAAALQMTQQAEEKVTAAFDKGSSLAALFAALPDGAPLRRRISKSLNRRGRVRDDASARLVELRRRVHRLRDGLYKQLQETLSQHEEHFSETTVSLKDGRLTLLLQATSRGRLGGLVHGRSGSGRSLYFEPLAAVEGNNDLQETLEEEEGERRRILHELIAEARRQLPMIRSHLEVLGELDMLQGICRFAELSDAHLPQPASQGELVLVQARHPLLDPALAALREAALGQTGHLAPIVPLDLELDHERRVLVVTGPNAGGKTVALKTVGLLVLAAQCGLPIASRPGSRIPQFRKVMAMVGDEQDLLTDRSTFSARLQRLREAWEVASPDSLVLLDELGSGTDPQEGTALGIALLEALLESGSVAILTTHFTQLAAVSLERRGAACAAMEFDPDSGRPTYRLMPGAPGGSRALELAKRLGLPRPWLERAEELLGGEHLELRQLLREVEAVRQKLAAAQAQVRSEHRAIERQRQQLEEQSRALRAERRELGPKLQCKLEAFRREVTDRLRSEVTTLREQVHEGRRKGLVTAAAERLFETAPRFVEDEGPYDWTPAPGAAVRHRSLGWRGTLEKARGDQAQVQVRGKRIRCALDELAPAEEDTGDSTRRPPEVQLVSGAESEDEVSAELSLLGLRVEPALEALDRYLDRAMLSDRKEVRIVHGHGSGRLRAAVREHLEPHPAVAGFRPGRRNEGADGATVVTLNKV